MIIDSIENSYLYISINEGIKKVFNFIQNNELNKYPLGKNNLDDNSFYFIVNEYVTKLDLPEILECHKKYLDLHFVIRGSEVIKYEVFKKHTIYKSYNEEEDYALYINNFPLNLVLLPEMFAIFFPNDLHMPGYVNKSTSELKKIVFKILID